MATSVGQEDVEKINDDKANVQNVDGLVHEGDLPNYKPDDNASFDKKEGDGVGVGLDGGADAKASGLECILNQSSTESANKKKKKNKKKKRNNKVGVSDSGGLGVNQDLVDKDSDDVSVGSLSVEPDVETVVKDIEKQQSISEQEVVKNKDQKLNKESDDISIRTTESDVETVVKEIEKKQAISEQEAELQVVKNEEQELGVANKSEFSQVQEETAENLEPAQGLEYQIQDSDAADNADSVNDVQPLFNVESEHEMDYNQIIQSALDYIKETNFENHEESELKEVVEENTIAFKDASEEPKISESVLGDKELAENVDITLQPSVNFIFQSDGNNQIGPSESSAHFTESESALAAELNSASRCESYDGSVQDSAKNTEGYPEQGHSENALKISQSADSVGDQSDTLSEFCDPTDPILTTPNYFEELQEQHAWTRIDTSHLQPDDIYNHNFLRSDSQDFENRWEKECYLRQGSDTSIKMPTVPNPSFDNIELARSDQAASELQPSFGKQVSEFLENKAAWKEQYPNFVGKVQLAVGEIVDIATDKMEALVNRQDENESSESVSGLDLGFGLISEIGTKASDSMNNLYEVEGDLEYAARYGTNSSENFSYEQHASQVLNGETSKAESVSIEEMTEDGLGRQASQGFLVDGGRQESNEENFGGYETLNNLDCDHFDYGDALTTQNVTAEEGLALAQLDEEFKSTNELDNVDAESQDNDVFYDAKSNSTSSYQSTTTSPREPRLTELVVEETLDISFNSKLQYFESEVQKVALSSSQQYLKTPSQTQAESGLSDPIATTSQGIGQTNAKEQQSEVESIEVLIPNKSKPKHKRFEDVKSYQEYISAPKDYEGIDWTKYTMILPKTPEEAVPHRYTIDELAAVLNIKDDSSQERVRHTREVRPTYVNPFDQPSETQFDDVPLRREVPFEEVQQKYDRPLTNERKCGSLRRAVPCLFHKTAVSAPNSEADLLNSDVDGAQIKTGSLSNKSTGQPNDAIAGTSGYNSTEHKGSLERGRDSQDRRILERGGTLDRIKRWKTLSLKRFSKDNP